MWTHTDTTCVPVLLIMCDQNCSNSIQPSVATLSTMTDLDNVTVYRNATSSVANYSHDALLYIITVLMFYSISIVILMVKYIRREKQEADLQQYYHEYVSREKFHSPLIDNKRHMDHFFKSKSILEYFKTTSIDPKSATRVDGKIQQNILSEETTI